MIKVGKQVIKFGKFADGTCKVNIDCSTFQPNDPIIWLYDNDDELMKMWFLVQHCRDHEGYRRTLSMPFLPNSRQDRVVNDDDVTVYENEDVIGTLPNNQDSQDLIRYMNNLIFVIDDIERKKKDCYKANKKCNKSLLRTIACIVVTLGLLFFKAPFILYIASCFFSGYYLSKYHKADKEFKKQSSLLNKYDYLKNKFECEIARCRASKEKDKVTPHSLTFTNEQITLAHRAWTQEFGDTIDPKHDLDIIEKVYVHRL